MAKPGKFASKRLKKMLLYQDYITHMLKWELGLLPEIKDMESERMEKWFSYSHLPHHLQEASKPFHDLMTSIITSTEAGPERTVALRKLLEAKDAAVRAKLHPGC